MEVEEKEEDRKEKYKETIIIFDWDDTLFPCYYLQEKKYTLTTVLEDQPDWKEVKQELDKLEEILITLLKQVVECGEVHIITNSEENWVSYSCMKFLPKVFPYLSRIKICSAQTTYKTIFPDSPYKWKYYAFHKILSKPTTSTTTTSSKTVISFGDSLIERNVTRTITSEWQNCYIKTIKFADRPTITQLIKQLELIHICFLYIYTSLTNLDLQLTITEDS